ncbi:MAG: hypothetical protein ACYSWO_00835 [Planctomycetota bacterium]
MRKRLSATAVALLLGLSVSIISGCSADRADLVDSGFLTLEKEATGKVGVAWSSVHEHEDGLLITGVLRRRDRIGSPIKAYVDVTVLSPGGKVVETVRSGHVYVPRRITGRGQSFKRFKVYLPNVPVRGSSIRLVSHSGLHGDAI